MNRVLIIDDDEDMRSMLLQLMERVGIEAIGARDGNDGLQQFDAFQPNLVITDIVMPGKEGLETIIEMRRKYPDVSIIAISGGGRVGPDSYLPIAKQFGARYVFAKPLNRNEFLFAVRQCLSTKA
ncbi:MAG: response regulator [Fibrobacterota bacterium]|nr:response regulator [Chitinispirillaceae bacterium]